MIAEARRRARESHAPITFEVGEVQALPFPDGTFDVCRAERLLEHLPDAGRALSGWIGRQLPRLFKEQHMAVLQTNGTLSAGGAQRWWEYLQQAGAQRTLLIRFTAFIIVGAKS